MSTDNNQWQHNVIPSNFSRRAKNKDWLFLLVLIGCCGFILYENRDDLLTNYRAGDYLEMKELFVLLFPLLFFWKRIGKSLGAVNYGETPFIMNPFPAVIGGKFAGYTEINKKVEGLQFSGELRLTESREIFTESDTEVETHTIYRLPVSIQTERAMLGMRLLVEAKIPENNPALLIPREGQDYSWQLHVSSNDRSFRRSWKVPVTYKNSDSFINP